MIEKRENTHRQGQKWIWKTTQRLLYGHRLNREINTQKTEPSDLQIQKPADREIDANRKFHLLQLTRY